MNGGNFSGVNTSLTTSNIVLKCALNKNSFFNIAHINAQSLRSSIDSLRYTFSDVNLDAICISESWLKDNYPDSAVNITNYYILRNDRSARVGGGVCVYLKSHIKSKIIRKSQPMEKLEYIFIEIMIADRAFLLGCFYIPPRMDCVDDLDEVLSTTIPAFQNIILVGDFNFDTLSPMCSRSLKFVDLINQYSLKIHNNEPTHFYTPTLINSKSSSCLDLFISNQSHLIKLQTQISLPDVSHHDLIFVSFDIPSTERTRTFFYRDYKGINMDNLLNHLMSLNWNCITESEDVNFQIQCFNDTFLDLYNSHVHLREIRPRKVKPSWLTSTVLNAMVERDCAYNNWKRSKTDEAHNSFRLLRNRATNIIRAAKHAFLKTKCDPSLPPKQFWNNVKSLGVGKSSTTPPNYFNPEEFNVHFTTNNQVNNSIASDTIASNTASTTNITARSFSFMEITDELIYRAVMNIRSNAIGYDDIDIKFLKLVLPYIVHILCHVFNCIIKFSTYPNAWKIAKVIPLPKTNSPSRLNDYRPISLLPVLSKVFEYIIRLQILEHVNVNLLLSDYQSGFRENHSTTTALLNIFSEIRHHADNRRFTLLVLLDFTKAFDSVDFSILCEKLELQFGFSTNAIKLMKSYLSNRSQFVCSNNKNSTIRTITSGVPQGSLLGPILFSLFINDVSEAISSCKYHLYADDLQIFIDGSLNDVENTTNKLNSDLNNVSIWSRKNRLMLNVVKTQLICFYKGRIELSNFPLIALNEEPLTFRNKVKNLGLWLDNDLSWDSQISQVTKTVFNKLRVLWSSTQFAEPELRKKIFFAFIFPYFIYCDVVLFRLNKTHLKKLNRVFNACVRYIFGLRKFEHISSYVTQVLDVGLENYFNLRVLSQLYKIIATKEPRYLFDKLTFANSSRTGNLLINLNPHTSAFVNSFFVRGVSLYNSLPLEVKNSDCHSTFRRCAAEFLGDESYWN